MGDTRYGVEDRGEEGIGVRVLVIEDDPAAAGEVAAVLQGEGHFARICSSGEEGLEVLSSGRFHAVVLDVGLPQMSGFEVARYVRSQGDTTPILMLTAFNEDRDIVRGLDLGADDYLSKPFRSPELLARLRALVRRAAASPRTFLSYGDLEIDLVSRAVLRGGNEVRLTKTEFLLLVTLVDAAGRIVPRKRLLSLAMGFRFDPGTATLDTHLSNLRRKLRSFGPPLIQNVRRKGYRLIHPKGPPSHER